MSHTQIPVAAARGVGEQFKKDMVVLFAYDRANDRTDVVTWARESTDKELAVAVADRCICAVGLDMSSKIDCQDYRFIEEGDRAKIIDELVIACRMALAAVDEAYKETGFHRIADTSVQRETIEAAIRSATEAA